MAYQSYDYVLFRDRERDPEIHRNPVEMSTDTMSLFLDR